MPEFITNPSVDPWMLSSFSGLKTKQNVLCTSMDLCQIVSLGIPRGGISELQWVTSRLPVRFI